jgi:hypothetical protein
MQSLKSPTQAPGDAKPKFPGLEWVEQKLGDPKACYAMFRMSPDLFRRLHSLLIQYYGLKSTGKSTLKEALGMFLWMLGPLNQLGRLKTDLRGLWGLLAACLAKS